MLCDRLIWRGFTRRLLLLLLTNGWIFLKDLSELFELLLELERLEVVL
jgi:hypothetical protein